MVEERKTHFEATTQVPNPRAERVKPEKVEVSTAKAGVEAGLFTIYVLYRANWITRIQLKSMLKIINETPPKSIPQFLVEEAAKA